MEDPPGYDEGPLDMSTPDEDTVLSGALSVCIFPPACDSVRLIYIDA